MRRVSVAGPAPDRLAAGLASGAISTLYALEVLVAEPLVPRGLGYGNRRRGVKCDTAAGTAAAWRVRAFVPRHASRRRGAKGTITNATYTKPRHVATYVKSETHNAFGRGTTIFH